MLEDIGNTVSSDLLYRGLVTLLGWLLLELKVVDSNYFPFLFLFFFFIMLELRMRV